MTDFDLHIGFWISNLPYLWVPSNNLGECKRYYLSQGKISLFDNHNFIGIDITSKGEDLCILPLGNIGTCNLVRNCFLSLFVTDSLDDKEIRIEGVKITTPLENKGNDLSNGVVNIIDPDTNYIGMWRYYPAQFAKTIPKDVIATIKLTTQRGTRSFNNIMDAVKVMRIVNKEDYKRIHIEALVNVYTELRTVIRDQSITQKEDLVHQLLKEITGTTIPTINKNGWKYDINTSFLVAHIQYEILMGEKLEYPLTPKGDTSNNDDNLKPIIAGKVVYTNHSLRVTRKITGDRSSSNIDALLNNFYGKKANLPMWSTNKSPNKSQFKKYLDEISRYKTYTSLQGNTIYIDIGSGSGEDAIILAKELGCKNPIFADIKDVTTVSSIPGSFVQIINFEPLFFNGGIIQNNSVDFISMFHSLHHMPDAEFRLKNVVDILKPGGFFLLKDHDVLTKEDANNVSFEHFVYSVGEGKATINDKGRYNDIEPMYYFSADQVMNFMKGLNMKLIFISRFNNPIKTYQAMFQKG